MDFYNQTILCKNSTFTVEQKKKFMFYSETPIVKYKCNTCIKTTCGARNTEQLNIYQKKLN